MLKKLFISVICLLILISTFSNSQLIYANNEGSKSYQEYLSMIDENAIQSGNYMTEEQYNAAVQSITERTLNKDIV